MADTQAQVPDTTFGEPTDASAPPWSSYNDPTRAQTALRLAADAEQEALQADVNGSSYRFDGHSAPGNETEILVTSVGRVNKGEVIKLPVEEFDKLTSLGFTFSMVENAPVADDAKSLNDPETGAMIETPADDAGEEKPADSKRSTTKKGG